MATEHLETLHCHRERRYMVERQPHLVRWLPIAVPFDRYFVWDNERWAIPSTACSQYWLRWSSSFITPFWNFGVRRRT